LKKNWRVLAELLAVISVVLSLIFVGYELRLNRNIAANESYASAIDIETSIREYLSQYPAILARGCLNEELSIGEDVIFTNQVRTIDRLGFFRWLRAGQGISGIGRFLHASRD